MRSAVGETARTDAIGASESRDNDTNYLSPPCALRAALAFMSNSPPSVSFATVSTIATCTHAHYRSLRSDAYCIESTCTSRKLHVTLNKSLNGHM